MTSDKRNRSSTKVFNKTQESKPKNNTLFDFYTEEDWDGD